MDTNTINQSTIEQWALQKMDIKSIKEELSLKGYSEQEIDNYIHAFKKLKYKKRKSSGFILMATGSFVGFISCVLTMTDAVPGMSDFFLYGLTSLAVCMVFWGMYLVFEG